MIRVRGRDVMMESVSSAALRRWRRGREKRIAGGLWKPENRKGKETDSPLEAPGGIQPC